MKNTIIAILMLAVLIVSYFLFPHGQEEFSSAELGLSFSYPENYFLTEVDESTGERTRYALVLAEDTEENRRVFEGKEPGREAPPTITIGIFQNNLDDFTAERWVKSTSFSNFKLSDGNLTESQVGGETALLYDATGLYENKNAVVARPDFVYMFTVFYLTPDDAIIEDFEKVLESVQFGD